jgi:hypothetical protein
VLRAGRSSAYCCDVTAASVLPVSNLECHGPHRQIRVDADTQVADEVGRYHSNVVFHHRNISYVFYHMFTSLKQSHAQRARLTATAALLVLSGNMPSKMGKLTHVPTR